MYRTQCLIIYRRQNSASALEGSSTSVSTNFGTSVRIFFITIHDSSCLTFYKYIWYHWCSVHILFGNGFGALLYLYWLSYFSKFWCSIWVVWSCIWNPFFFYFKFYSAWRVPLLPMVIKWWPHLCDKTHVEMEQVYSIFFISYNCSMQYIYVRKFIVIWLV